MGRNNMNIWALVSREIRFRKAGFIIGLICVTAAIGSLVGAFTLIRTHDIRTEMILEEREKETRAEMEALENDYRLIMRDLGHNVMILHADQSLTALRAKGYPDAYMPEDYAERLGRGGIETLNHLLPVLQERITWPEREIEIILTGTPGQIPVYHLTRFLTEDGQAYRNPITPPVPEGALRIGHAVARDLGLREGDSVTLMGEEMVIEKIYPNQGDQSDIMVWCDLESAQRWLDKEGLINAIFALECVCHIDGLGLIADEVVEILPDTQALEFSSRVIARGEARQRAEREAKRAIDAEIEHRRKMNDSRRAFAAVLAPVVLMASGLWIFFLTLGNVRERESEIGILRAIGVRETKIMGVFLLRSVIIGVAGALAGYLIGVIVGAVWGGVPPHSPAFRQTLNPMLLLVSLFIAATLCAVASWVPALIAAHRDPADVLRKE